MSCLAIRTLFFSASQYLEELRWACALRLSNIRFFFMVSILGEMERLLTEKVEELTLYVIELRKEIDTLKEQIKE